MFDVKDDLPFKFELDPPVYGLSIFLWKPSINSDVLGREIGFFSSNLFMKLTNLGEYRLGRGLGNLWTILNPRAIKLSP